jgi:N-glycosylase/DNA lyase
MVENEFFLKRSNINAVEREVDGYPCVVLRGVKYFSVEKTFDCGQCFRFERVEEEGYDACVCGVAFGKYIKIAESEGVYYLFGTDIEEYRSLWRPFLGLDMNYPKMCERILRENAEYPIVSQAELRSRGIRILIQDKWEALCSFIISQNNNIPRIKKIIERLCTECGEKFTAFDGSEHYSFPSPEAVINGGIDMLKDIGTGFRAKYIMDAAERVVSGRINFDYVSECDDTEECTRHLCEIYGVGVKVASCVLLFAFEKYDAFPKDVWILRVLDKYFEKGFDPERLGEYKGIVQQWLFYNERYAEE